MVRETPIRLTGVAAGVLLIVVIAPAVLYAIAPSSDGALAVSIENCGTSIVYPDAPRRAFTMNQAATEIMLALGLHERMVGTAFLDDAILPEFAGAYEKIQVRTAAYPSREVLLSAQPDFVYAAYPSAFSNQAPGMQELLQSGTPSYLSPSRCEKGSGARSHSAEAIFDEIRDIARIFRVLPRAEKLIAHYRADLESIRTQLGAVEVQARVLWWDSGMPPQVAGCCGAPNEILRIAGAQNVFHDLPRDIGAVRWDAVIERNPDVIVLVDASWAPAAQKERWLRNIPALAEMDAVKNNRFVTVSFSEATPGIRNIAAARKVAQALYPEKFREAALP